nr:hypothetical protein [Mesobacillus harenae]
MENPFHACATCVHFRADKPAGNMTYTCSRLGFETKPAYKFQCWKPKQHIIKLMEKRSINPGGSL